MWHVPTGEWGPRPTMMMGQVEKTTHIQSEQTAEYEVGYRRPPKHTRFRRGISGNPKGRPRVLKNLAVVFETALNERVPVNDNGKRKKITMFEAIAKQAVRKAAGGDQRALRLVIDLWFRLHPEGKQEPSALDLMRSLAKNAARVIEEEKAEAAAG